MRRHHLWRLRHARRLFAQNPSDLYHLLDGSMAGFLPSKVWKKTIVTVHDLIPLLQMKGVLTGNPRIFGRLLIWRMLKALRHVAGVASVSSHTAKDIFNYTGRSDGTVIHHPVRSLPELIAGLENVTIETPQPIQAYAHPSEGGGLFKSPPWEGCRNGGVGLSTDRATISQSLNALDLLHRYIFYVGNNADYKKAAVFLFQSFYKGFGMPVLEAMQAFLQCLEPVWPQPLCRLKSLESIYRPLFGILTGIAFIRIKAGA